jgi:hypothetical protein
VDRLSDQGADALATPPADGAVVLVLVPVADPMLRTHGTDRSPEYRLRLALKALLRGFESRATVTWNTTADELSRAGR